MSSAASTSPFTSAAGLVSRSYASDPATGVAVRSNSVRLCLRCRAPMRAPLQEWCDDVWYWIRWHLGYKLWRGERANCPSCGRMHLFSVEIRPFGVSRPPQERCD